MKVNINLELSFQKQIEMTQEQFNHFNNLSLFDKEEFLADGFGINGCDYVNAELFNIEHHIIEDTEQHPEA